MPKLGNYITGCTKLLNMPKLSNSVAVLFSVVKNSWVLPFVLYCATQPCPGVGENWGEVSNGLCWLSYWFGHCSHCSDCEKRGCSGERHAKCPVLPDLLLQVLRNRFMMCTDTCLQLRKWFWSVPLCLMKFWRWPTNSWPTPFGSWSNGEFSWNVRETSVPSYQCSLTRYLQMSLCPTFKQQQTCLT